MASSESRPPRARAAAAAAVDIRRLRPDDSIEELTDLLHRAYGSLAVVGLHSIAASQPVDVTRRRIENGECYVGVTPEGRIVATVTFHAPGAAKYDSPWLDRPDVCCFGQFAVEPAIQGTGLGRRLVELCERRTRETGAAELALNTAEPARHLIALYEHLGFRVVEYARWPEVNYRSVVMSKRIATDPIPGPHA